MCKLCEHSDLLLEAFEQLHTDDEIIAAKNHLGVPPEWKGTDADAVVSCRVFILAAALAKFVVDHEYSPKTVMTMVNGHILKRQIMKMFGGDHS